MIKPQALFAILLCLGLAAPTARGAATANPLAALAGANKPASPAPAPAAPALSAAQLDAAVTTLENPRQRTALIATLQAMSKEAAAKKAAKPPRPEGEGALLIDEISARVGFFFADAEATLRSATDLSLIWNWILLLVANPYLSGELLQTLGRIGLALATALVAETLACLILARAQDMVVARAARIRRGPRHDAYPAEDEGTADAEAGASEWLPRRRDSLGGFLLRVFYGILHLVLSVLPLAAFAGGGFVWLPQPIMTVPVTRLAVVAVLNAYLICRLVLEVARFLVAPSARPLRLIRMTDYRAAWLVRWLRRIVAVIAFGYAVVVIGGLFGLYPLARMVLFRLISLVVHVMLAIMVVQARRPVAALIRGRPGSTGAFASLRRGLAGVWHIIALFYILALWIAWVLGIPNAFGSLLRVVAVFVGGVALARCLEAAVARLLSHAFAEDARWKAGHPTLYSRGRSYIPAVRLTIGITVGVVAFLVILQGWGIGILSWLFGTQIGVHIVTTAVSIAATVVAAFVVWEAVNAALDARVDGLIARGRTARAVRLNTLLPMLRSTLMVAIFVIAGLVMLSAVGVNVTLLLGGLSIFGLAIGFGSQKLVQDVITGLFLLLEDAVQVGDWVTVGGISGSVEKLSIRNIRLRGFDGTLNIVPFSAITTVVNSSRDFCYAPLNIGVGYKEDVDRVQAVLQEIFDGMKAEPQWAAQIIGDFELWGLDQFGASALMIVGRIRTPAGKQHAVRREFNRRVKMRFDAEGIEIPFSYQKITIDPAEFREAFARPAEARPALQDEQPEPRDAAPPAEAQGEQRPRFRDAGAANL